ncbi:hypothetical protein SFR_1543 [Streptomyces sp. FR-008]|nr:hypothetical protein SFR_1543 [Streptomyces sp. FR-008]
MDDHRRGGVLEVGVAVVQGEGVTLEVDVEAVEAVGVDDGADGVDEGVAGLGCGEPDLSVLAADGDQHLLPGLLLRLHRGFELGLGLDSGAFGRRAETEAYVAGGDRGGLAEGEVDDVPAVGHVGEPGVAGPVGEAGVQVADEGVFGQFRSARGGRRVGRGGVRRHSGGGQRADRDGSGGRAADAATSRAPGRPGRERSTVHGILRLWGEGGKERVTVRQLAAQLGPDQSGCQDL